MKNIKSAQSQQERANSSRRSILTKDTHSSWLEKWLCLVIRKKKVRRKPINDGDPQNEHSYAHSWLWTELKPRPYIKVPNEDKDSTDRSRMIKKSESGSGFRFGVWGLGFGVGSDYLSSWVNEHWSDSDYQYAWMGRDIERGIADWPNCI